MTIGSKGPYKSSKCHNVGQRSPILEFMRPRAQCKTKVIHLEELQHMLGFGLGPHHGNIIFLEANNNLID